VVLRAPRSRFQSRAMRIRYILSCR
jgi:hypothetical protein